MKPGFFKNEDLAALSPMHRLCFAGLWLMADRKGVLEDRPRRIKGELFAYDAFDIEPIITDLETSGFIFRFAVKENKYIKIVNFSKHQRPHKSESHSELPDCIAKDGETPLSHGETPSSHGEPALHNGDGERRTENGERGLENGERRTGTGIRTLSSASADFETFRTEYPASRRVGGKAGRRAYDGAAKTLQQSVNGRHLAVMLAALALQKRSVQWQDPKLIPLMTTWLNQERWNQTLPASKPHTPTKPWCEHTPKCTSPDWHRVVLSREAK